MSYRRRLTSLLTRARDVAKPPRCDDCGRPWGLLSLPMPWLSGRPRPSTRRCPTCRSGPDPRLPTPVIGPASDGTAKPETASPLNN